VICISKTAETVLTQREKISVPVTAVVLFAPYGYGTDVKLEEKCTRMIFQDFLNHTIVYTNLLFILNSTHPSSIFHFFTKTCQYE